MVAILPLDKFKPWGWGDKKPAEEIEKLENKFRTTFPDDYRSFLISSNGGRLLGECVLLALPATEDTAFTPDLFFGIGLVGVDRKLEIAPLRFEDYCDDDPVLILPIGSSGAGELICLNLGLPPIGEVSLFSFGNRYVLASSFSIFLTQVIEGTV